MPKTPIQYRSLLFTRLRDKTIRLLDWCLVQTSLGPAYEPRVVQSIQNVGNVVQRDVYDANYSDIREVEEGAFFQGVHGGIQVPADYNTQ